MTTPYVKADVNPHTGKIEYRSIGSTIKAIDSKRVGGHLVRFTNADDLDLHGEYFDKTTNFWLKEFPIEGKPILIDHAFDNKFKSIPVGILDFVRKEEVGIWVEGKLHDSSEYERMLMDWRAEKYIDASDNDIRSIAANMHEAVLKFFGTGKVHWSSGAMPQTVDVADNGHIKSWAIIEGTGVVTPAEPDGTEISLLKSVFDYLPHTDTTAPTGETAHKEANGTDVVPPQKDETLPVGETTMVMTKASARETVRQALDEVVQQELASVVESIAQELGMPVAPEDAAAIAEDAAATIEESVDEVAGDTMMAAIPDDEENKQKKALRAHQLVLKHLYSATYRHYGKQKQNRESARQDAQKAAKAEYEKSLPGVPKTGLHTNGNNNPNNSNGSNHTNKWGELTVGDIREFAGLSAVEMALVVKLARSQLSGYERTGMKMSQLVEKGILSESFVRTAAHKAATHLKNWQLRGQGRDVTEENDYAAMKSVNWLKADELGATDITNQGAEWVELFYDTQAWRRVRDETQLYDMLVSKGMRVKDVPQGTKGMNVKLVDGNGTAYTLQEGGSVDATGNPEVVTNPSFLTTNEIEANLATHIIAEGFTFQLEQRSMIDVATELNEDIVTTLAESLENTILNGDTRTAASTNINLIDGTPGTGLSTPDYIAWNGVRYEVLITNTANGIDNAGASLAAVDYERVRDKFPIRFRRRKQNILFVIDGGVETQTRRLAEHFTVGVAGESNATFFTGDLNVLVGYDVYASGFLGLTNGDGKISATVGNNVKGQIYGIFAPYWQYGRQLQINIEQARFPLAQSSVFVATVNHLLKPRSAYAAVGMYDIAVA